MLVFSLCILHVRSQVYLRSPNSGDPVGNVPKPALARRLGAEEDGWYKARHAKNGWGQTMGRDEALKRVGLARACEFFNVGEKERVGLADGFITGSDAAKYGSSEVNCAVNKLSRALEFESFIFKIPPNGEHRTYYCALNSAYVADNVNFEGGTIVFKTPPDRFPIRGKYYEITDDRSSCSDVCDAVPDCIGFEHDADHSECQYFFKVHPRDGSGGKKHWSLCFEVNYLVNKLIEENNDLILVNDLKSAQDRQTAICTEFQERIFESNTRLKSYIPVYCYWVQVLEHTKSLNNCQDTAIDCRNGGICRKVNIYPPEHSAYRCDCPESFTGVYCEHVQCLSNRRLSFQGAESSNVKTFFCNSSASTSGQLQSSTGEDEDDVSKVFGLRSDSTSVPCLLAIVVVRCIFKRQVQD